MVAADSKELSSVLYIWASKMLLTLWRNILVVLQFICVFATDVASLVQESRPMFPVRPLGPSRLGLSACRRVQEGTSSLMMCRCERVCCEKEMLWCNATRQV